MGSGQSGDIYAETLAVFDQRGRYEPLTTPEVTDALDVKRRTVYKRLQKLVDRDELETKETGSNARVWWRPPDATGSEGSSTDEAADQGETVAQRDGWSDAGYRETFEAMPDGVLLHDPADGTIIDANEQFCAMLGYSREELLALDFEAIHSDIPPYTIERAKQYVQQAATEGPLTFEWLDETKDGDHVPVEVHLRQTAIDGSDCILGVVRDISERKEREEEVQETAQQLQGILDTVEAAIFLKDTDGEYLLMNQNWREMAGIDSDEAVAGLTDGDIFPDAVASRQRADDQRVFERNETIEIEEEIPTPAGEKTVLTRKTPIFDETGAPYAVCAVATDITERKDRELELRASRRFNEELVENAPFGMFRLDERLQITYENPRAQEIIGLPEEMERSAAIGVDIRELPSIQETGEAAMFGRLRDGETIEFEFPFESIYGKEAYFTGRSVPLYRDGEFDGAVMMANDISEHRRHERELERQREQLAALNELNDVVRGITEAVINQSTREEIERVVCERLAGSDSYRFAWTGSVDSKLQLVPHVEAGTEGSLDGLVLSTDPADPTGQGPIGRAIRSREAQVNRHVHEDTDHDRRFHSEAAIPIVHQGTLYGVLAVYSGRPDAFAENEREVLAQLGEVIGHAISAVNNKRALMSDEVTELELLVPDLDEPIDVPTEELTVNVDRAVPVGDEHLLYGTATPGSVPALRALCEQLPGWERTRIISETDDEVRFEQQLSEPPIGSIVAAYGGFFEGGRIESGEYTVTIALPPGTDIRQVVEDIREMYPNVESRSQRQTTREKQLPGQPVPVLTEKLTERQSGVLEAAYYAGFFEWPRERSGEEVAASLGIGASTFHQHLRKAERKLLDVLFELD